MTRPSTDWLRDGPYGMMVHWIAPGPAPEHGARVFARGLGSDASDGCAKPAAEALHDQHRSLASGQTDLRRYDGGRERSDVLAHRLAGHVEPGAQLPQRLAVALGEAVEQQQPAWVG